MVRVWTTTTTPTLHDMVKDVVYTDTTTNYGLADNTTVVVRCFMTAEGSVPSDRMIRVQGIGVDDRRHNVACLTRCYGFFYSPVQEKTSSLVVSSDLEMLRYGFHSRC